MHVLHINSKQDVDKVNKFVDQGSDVFILVYMEGCGPCNATRPEWAKIEYALKDQYAKNNNLVVIDINKDFISDIKYIGDIDGFPTIKYIGNYGKTVEPYEKSSITTTDRSVNSFVNWIETKVIKVISTNPSSSSNSVYNKHYIFEKNVIAKTKSRNTKSRNTKSRNTKSRNTKSRNTKSRNTKSRNTKSRNT